MKLSAIGTCCILKLVAIHVLNLLYICNNDEIFSNRSVLSFSISSLYTIFSYPGKNEYQGFNLTSDFPTLIFKVLCTCCRIMYSCLLFGETEKENLRNINIIILIQVESNACAKMIILILIVWLNYLFLDLKYLKLKNS